MGGRMLGDEAELGGLVGLGLRHQVLSSPRPQGSGPVGPGQVGIVVVQAVPEAAWHELGGIDDDDAVPV